VINNGHRKRGIPPRLLKGAVEIFLSGANDRHSISTQGGVGAQLISPPLQTVGAKKVPTQVNNMLIKINEDLPLRCMTLIKAN
jgi:hypothetical protein